MVRGAWRGVRLRCPECAKGRIFQSRFTTRRTCEACAYEFLPGRGEFTGALMLAQGLIMVAAGLSYVTLRALTDWSPAWIGLGLLVFIVVAPIAAYTNIKGVWIGILHGSASSRSNP